MADERLAPCTAPATVVLADDTVIGPVEHGACGEIVVGPSYTVGATGELTLRTRGRVVLRDGFAVLAGGTLRVVIDPVAGDG